LSKVFHKALANIPKPEWFDKKTDVFAIADKIAWSELPLPNFEPTKEPLDEAQEPVGVRQGQENDQTRPHDRHRTSARYRASGRTYTNRSGS